MLHLSRLIRYYTSDCISQSPDQTLLLLLQNHSKSITKCKQIHAKLIVSNTISDTFTSNTLLNCYTRCSHLHEANLLFYHAPLKNVVTWTSIISSHVHHGLFQTSLHLFKQMLSSGQNPNQFTFSVTIRVCTNLNFLRMGVQIHALVARFGFERDEFAGSSLVDMYFKLGSDSLHNACTIFNGLYCRDSVTWNVMISGFAQISDFDRVLRLFKDMQLVDGLSPNDFTFTSLLKCCCCLGEVEQVHGLVSKSGTELDVVVGSALADLYGKCGDVDSGRKILDSMGAKDSFVWSSLISNYSRNGCGEEAVNLFKHMCRQGVKPDQHTLSSALKACVDIAGIEIGVQIHSQMIKSGHQTDCFVASVLLNLYADFKQMGEAEKVFRRIYTKDTVSWNSMIMGYAQMEEDPTLSCLKLYNELRKTTMLKHDGTTLVAVLKSCKSKSDIQIGLQIHTEILKSGFSHEIIIGNAVINLYSTCGSVEDAHRAFSMMIYRDDTSWSSIIGCYEKNGIEFEALRLCKEMLATGISLSCFSLPSCITACSNIAAMHLGKQFHSFVVKLGFEAEIYVGSSLIDMYMKCGSMEGSLRAFDEQCNPNTVTFNALISGFAQHGKAEEAINMLEKMEKMSIIPNRITFLAVLSACSHVGLVDKSLYLFKMMQQTYGIEPEIEHYTCLVDGLGRAGRLDDAYKTIQNIECDSAWRTVLGACRNYGNTEIGEKAARRVMELNPKDHASYVLLSSIYSGSGRWEESMELRQNMALVGIKKDPGSSWMINKDSANRFTVGSSSHPESRNNFDGT